MRGLKVWGNAQRLRLETTLFDQRESAVPRPSAAAVPANLVQGATAYARWDERLVALPGVEHVNERANGLVSCRRMLRPPSAYYRVGCPRAGETKARARRHRDAAAPLRGSAELNHTWTFVLETSVHL